MMSAVYWSPEQKWILRGGAVVVTIIMVLLIFGCRTQQPPVDPNTTSSTSTTSTSSTTIIGDITTSTTTIARWIGGPNKDRERRALWEASDRLTVDLSPYDISLINEVVVGDIPGTGEFGYACGNCGGDPPRACHAYNQRLNTTTFKTHYCGDPALFYPYPVSIHEQAHTVIGRAVPDEDRIPFGAGHPRQIVVDGMLINVKDALQVRWPSQKNLMEKVGSFVTFRGWPGNPEDEFICGYGDDQDNWR